MVGVFRFQKIQLIAEPQQDRSIFLADVGRILDTLSKGLDFSSDSAHGDSLKLIHETRKIMDTFWPRLAWIQISHLVLGEGGAEGDG